MEKDRQNIKDPLREIQVLRRFPIVGDSPAKIFLYKKAERLSVALHLVTNHVKDSEPAKWEVRNSAMEIVRSVSKLTRSGPTDRNDIIASLSEAVLRTYASIESLCEVGVVSFANASLIKRELAFLLQLADGHVGTSQDSGSIGEDIFDVPAVTDIPTPVVRRERAQPRASSERPAADAIEGKHQVASIGHMKDMSDTVTNTTVMRGGGDAVKSDRRSAIVNLLKTKSDLTVKDFKDVIPGVSEKTIQRELVDMVGTGILVRSGARRWTRYSLSAGQA